PCNLEARLDLNDIPACRAALKLLLMLEELAREQSNNPKIADIAGLIKSEYFRLGDEELRTLAERFDHEYAGLLRDGPEPPDQKREGQAKLRYRIGLWDADALENTFAYVGSELRTSEWLKRARKLIKELPSASATRELLNIDTGEQARDPD